MSDPNSPTQSAKYRWLILFLSACFLFYKYILQISPSVMSADLMRTYSLSGAGLGFLVGFYFYTYLLMQIPSGILLDKYGPHKVTTLAIFICATGIFLFAQTNSLVIAGLGRLMIGFGAAFGTTSYMKLSSNWFPQHYFPLLSGLFGTACMAGAGTAQAPLAWLISFSNWRHALLICALIGFILSIIFYLCVKDHPSSVQAKQQQDDGFSWSHFKRVLKKTANWPLLLYNGLAFTPAAVFGGLWGAPYLMASYHITKSSAAASVSLVFFGFAIGGILTGFIGKKARKQLPIIKLGTSLALACLMVILYLPALPLFLLNTFIFLLGFFSSGFLLSYAIARSTNNVALVATVIGFINMGDPLCGVIAEPLIGKILDLNWQGTLVNNVRLFSIHAYHLALSVLCLYFVLALICSVFIQETPYQEKENR